jgi:TolB-like protein/DNA-binding winged helix-turn-helix (wHTH) protein
MSNLYQFGEFVLDPAKRTLSRANSPVSLTPKAFDVLLVLAQNPNRLVTKDELLQAVWGDTFVEEGNLTQYISHLRKALDDDPEDTRLIATIARKGYQFTADVTVNEAADTAKQVAFRVPTVEGPLAGTQAVVGSPAHVAVPKAQKHWRNISALAALTLILAGAAYATWRHFAATATPGSPKIMLAVLPFENLTGDPNKEYLADGLTEETISQLGRLNPQQLGVIARTSVMGYKHKNERLDQIGRDLSVQYVLENSVRMSGNQIRLTAQLIQVKDQTHLWSQDYDYPMKDVLTVEDEVAKSVARQIQLRLTSQQQADLERPRSVNPDAFDAYLQGYHFYQRRTAKDVDLAAKYYQRATQLDPSYAIAWVGLSRSHYWQANAGVVPSEEGQRLARETVERALVLNPNLGAAHAQLGRLQRQVDFDWIAANASIQQAIALEPGNPEFVRVAASSAAYLGRFDQALRLARQAIDLDPLNADSWENVGEIEFIAGQLAKAAADCQKAVELNPDVAGGHFFLIQIYVMQGRPQDALPEIDGVGPDSLRGVISAITYYALGRKKESDATLTATIAKYHESDAYGIAEDYAFRNQSDEAFEWLDRAYSQRDGGLIATKVDPILKSLHNDPRFVAFLKKLNFPA